MSNSELDTMTDTTAIKSDKRGESIDLSVTSTDTIELSPGHCDECFGKINYNLGAEDFIPSDSTRTHHHCEDCGLIDYHPPAISISTTVSETVRHQRFKHWWGNKRMDLPTL